MISEGKVDARRPDGRMAVDNLVGSEANPNLFDPDFFDNCFAMNEEIEILELNDEDLAALEQFDLNLP
jgi:hypothetical protein